MSDNKTTGGMNFLGWLGLLFIALKLTGYITWSWWWVTAPLWAGAAVTLVILCIGLLMITIASLIELWVASRKRRAR